MAELVYVKWYNLQASVRKDWISQCPFFYFLLWSVHFCTELDLDDDDDVLWWLFNSGGILGNFTMDFCMYILSLLCIVVALSSPFFLLLLSFLSLSSLSWRRLCCRMLRLQVIISSIFEEFDLISFSIRCKDVQQSSYGIQCISVGMITAQLIHRKLFLTFRLLKLHVFRWRKCFIMLMFLFSTLFFIF